MSKAVVYLGILVTLFISSPGRADIAALDEVRQFIRAMVDEHGFDSRRLAALFRQVSIDENIIAAISRPAEARPWYKYRPIFLQAERVALGVQFWHEHKATLERASAVYGVPIEIMVAIIGVETRYGQYTGKYKVLEALASLAFAYPRRAKFFRGELEQFLLLTREQQLDPLSLSGSYAGAMGLPQFISSSYRHYAVDFDGDGRIDIWDNAVDAIGSVGNYFKEHGWQAGQPVIFSTTPQDDRYLLALSEGLKPELPAAELADYGLARDATLADADKVKLLEYEGADGVEYWLALHNFYVITRYNHSAMYALAVYQLAAEIRAAYLQAYGQEQ